MRTLNLNPDIPHEAENIKYIEELAGWYCEYLLCDGAYDFGDEAKMKRGIELLALIPKKGFYRSLPVNTWINRHLMGLRSIAFRLKARVNMRQISDEETGGVFD
ncbi:MAG: hypothetical protein IH897_13560 [Planctomycetes bacterium]|nr:hypothetical protein [Planctomycetota bacterium]